MYVLEINRYPDSREIKRYLINDSIHILIDIYKRHKLSEEY